MHIVGLQKTTLLDYPGKIAATIFTGGCNFRCPYCHNGDLVLNSNNMDEFSEEEILAFLKKRQKTLDGVCITGGEATLQNDLYDFISKIKELGLLVKLDTNGTNPTILSKLLNDNLINYVAMDIKHSREKYPDAIGNMNVDLNDIDKSISILINSDIEYEFRTTVCLELHSFNDFHDIGKWIENAQNYYLQPYKESDQVMKKCFSTYSKEGFEKIEKIIKNYNIKNVKTRTLD